MSDPTSENWLGKTIGGRYLVEKKLGAGAMGAVFVANQVSMDRKVALKLLHANLQGSEHLVRRFEREMKATSKVDHQNTVRVYDFGETDGGKLFLAMELVKGDSLKGVIEKTGTFETARALNIAIQIGRALNAAHSEGIVHRDLKPDNVMLVDRYGERDFVKVLDFGIARFVDETATQLTNDGQIMGTPLYIAPEQAQGTIVDHRADLYALGVILYQLVVGKVPFKSETLMGLLLMHAQELPPPPSEIAPGLVPQDVERLIMALLEKDPASRPQTASETVGLLEECLKRVGPGSAHHSVQPAATIANPGKQLKGAGSTVGLGTPNVPKSIDTLVAGANSQERRSRTPLFAAVGAIVGVAVVLGILAASGVFSTPQKDESQSNLVVTSSPSPTPEKSESKPEASAETPNKDASPKPSKITPKPPTPDTPSTPANVDASKATTTPAKAPTSPSPSDASQSDAAKSAAADAKAQAAAKEESKAFRRQLVETQRRMDDPPAPLRCRIEDRDVLSVLTRVAGLLQQAAVGSNTALDKIALPQLTAIQSKAETSAEFWSLLALAQLATDSNEAIQQAPISAARATALCAEWPVGHRLLGNAAYRAKDYDRAISAYKRALALRPQYPKAETNLALAQLKGAKYEDAVETATAILKARPRNPAALDTRYKALFTLKRFAEAEKDLFLLVEIQPNNKLLWFNLGGARAMQKKPTAKDAFCRAKALGHEPAAPHCPD